MYANDWQAALERDVLPHVTKPARYAGNEWNSVVKDWDDTRLRFCVIYPDTYELGMSNLAIQIIYDQINRRPDMLCERAFAAWADMEQLLREHKVPLFSLETRHSLRDFDILGFSLGYEQTYTNVLTMLDLAGVPIRAEDRTDDDPLVIAGGNCVFNPEPMARFFERPADLAQAHALTGLGASQVQTSQFAHNLEAEFCIRQTVPIVAKLAF